MTLIIAVPKESLDGENRVALVPATVERLCQQPGVGVRLQAGAGRGAGFYDADYVDSDTAQVTVHERFGELVSGARIVVKVNPPTLAEARLLPPGSVLLSQISAFQHADLVRVLLQRRVTCLAMDMVPRITRAQPMDVLSSQATVAGYKAALLAAELSPRLFPMLTTAAGTLRPSRVIVIGAGVAGLQAIATARRLGAQVEAYDIRRAAKEQIESLGARMIDTGVDAESAGGYARALTREEKQTQHDVLAERMSKAHAVICAAAIPGRRAPRIVTQDMVEGMMPDTVLIDMAAETGGNCELTRPGEHYLHGDTLILGPLNLPSTGAVHASEMYSRNLLNMLQLLIVEGELVLDWDDDIVSGCLLTHDGQVYHGATAELLDVDCAEPLQGRRVGVVEKESTDADGWISEEGEPGTADLATLDETPLPDDTTTADIATGHPAETVNSSAADEHDTIDPERPADADDLTCIEGIGPAIHRRLNDFGIYYLVQLAALDEPGMQQLQTQIEVEDDAAVGDWVRQAIERVGKPDPAVPED